MEVIGEEVPLTSGEVYAIARRCRDTRYAKGCPRFGLQSRSVPGVPQSSAQFQSRANRGSGHSAAKKGAQGPSSGQDETGTELAIHANIGFEEILLIASLGRTGGQQQVYGPSSCYSSSAATEPMLQQLAQASPGTIRFATTVEAQLTKWEQHGQAAERAKVLALRNIFSSNQDSMMIPYRIVLNPPVTGSEVRQLLAIAPTTAAHVYAILGDLDSRASVVPIPGASGEVAVDAAELVVSQVIAIFATHQ